MSVVQSLAVAAAALVMSYASAGPPVAMRAAIDHAAALAGSAEIAAERVLLDLVVGIDERRRTACRRNA